MNVSWFSTLNVFNQVTHTLLVTAIAGTTRLEPILQIRFERSGFSLGIIVGHGRASTLLFSLVITAPEKACCSLKSAPSHDNNNSQYIVESTINSIFKKWITVDGKNN